MTEQLTFFYCIGSEVYHDREGCRYLRRSRFQVIISGDGLRLCHACRKAILT